MIQIIFKAWLDLLSGKIVRPRTEFEQVNPYFWEDGIQGSPDYLWRSSSPWDLEWEFNPQTQQWEGHPWRDPEIPF